MQEDATKQAEVFSRYGIRTIFFAHTDQTPWAQSFVERMLKDQHWRMVYLDSAMFIMTTDTSRHDIRDDHAYLNSLVDSETDYLDLLQLANMLSGIDGNLAMKAFGKASLINPSSCNIVRNVYQQRLTNPVLGSAEQLKKDNWICF